MSLFEGDIVLYSDPVLTSYDIWLLAIKDILLNYGGFNLVSDTGSANNRKMIFSKPGFTHNLSISFSSSYYLVFTFLKIDGVTDLKSVSASVSFTTYTKYRLITRSNLIAFFLYNGGTYRCVFMYASIGDNKFQFIRKTSLIAQNGLDLIGESDETLNHNNGFVRYLQTTATGKQILTPVYLPSADNVYLLDTPLSNVFGFPNSSAAIGEGIKLNVNGKFYITSTYYSSSVELLIEYE